jgi:peptidoglycan/LPS O-acetylase OafA/YrhL
VAAGHVRDFLFLDYPGIGASNVAVKAFYALTGLGHEAVMVFFVLSGYLVGGGLVRDGVGRASLQNYFIHRFSRIYIVLLPALAVTLLLDLLGSGILPSLYDEPGRMSSLSFAVTDRDSLAVLACNMANLQDAFCPSFGSNGPLWSLAYEWFYYITFPVILAVVGAFKIRRPTVAQLALYALGLLAAVYVFPAYMSYYLVWLVGVAARVLGPRYAVSRPWAYSAAVVVVIFLGLSRARIGPILITDILIGLSLAIGLSRAKLGTSWPMLRGVNAWLAGFSYSLYVTHFPVVVFLHAVLVGFGVIEGRLMPGWTAFGLFFACGALIYAAAWAFSLATERQTYRLRVLLSGWFATSQPLEVVGNPRS